MIIFSWNPVCTIRPTKKVFRHSYSVTDFSAHMGIGLSSKKISKHQKIYNSLLVTFSYNKKNRPNIFRRWNVVNQNTWHAERTKYIRLYLTAPIRWPMYFFKHRKLLRTIEHLKVIFRHKRHRHRICVRLQNFTIKNTQISPVFLLNWDSKKKQSQILFHYDFKISGIEFNANRDIVEFFDK